MLISVLVHVPFLPGSAVNSHRRHTTSFYQFAQLQRVFQLKIIFRVFRLFYNIITLTTVSASFVSLCKLRSLLSNKVKFSYEHNVINLVTLERELDFTIITTLETSLRPSTKIKFELKKS